MACSHNTTVPPCMKKGCSLELPDKKLSLNFTWEG
jgi:hypothetical protein